VAKPVIGLLGGIGSGKSRVAEAMGTLGALVLDADRAAHRVLQEPDVRQWIVGRWGEAVEGPEGRIDRERLASIVFADRFELEALEALVWPPVRREFQRRIAAGQADPECRAIVLDVPKLLEAGWDRLCDRLLFVEAPAEVRLARVGQERGWTAEQLAARETMQRPLQQKRLRADYVIDNGGEWADTQAQLRQVFQEILDRS